MAFYLECSASNICELRKPQSCFNCTHVKKKGVLEFKSDKQYFLYLKNRKGDDEFNGEDDDDFIKRIKNAR